MNGESSLEWTIRIAASIAVSYQSKQAAVECCFRERCIKLGHGTSGIVRFFDQLSNLESVAYDTPADNPRSQGNPTPSPKKNRSDCGVFEVRITTQKGLQQVSERRSIQGDQLCIVLSNEHSDESTFIKHTKFGRTIWIRQADDPLLAFQNSWEKLCHVG
jgi:hypothetical protein